MAVGDFEVFFSGDNVSLSVVPAAGVVLLCTSLGNSLSLGVGSGQPIQLTDGVDFSAYPNGGTGTRSSMTECKIFITNSHSAYVGALGAGLHTSFCTMQVK